MNVSDALTDLMFKAVDHGVDSVGSGPLIPFVMKEEHTGSVTLVRFVADTLEAGVEKARQAVSGYGREVVRVAFAYDGYLRVDQDRFDAVFVEAFERGAGDGTVFVQRYRVNGGKVETIGNVAYTGNTEQMLRG